MQATRSDDTARGDSLPSWVCPSCGSTASDRYCGHCGERRIGDSLFGPESDAAAPARSFPIRLSASLRALASPPGRLTADWIRGRRMGYLPPLSLFLWINVAFFIVQSVSGLGVLTWPLRAHLADDSISWITTRLLAQHRPDMIVPTDAYTSVFDALESVHAKSLVILMVPAFAVVLTVLLRDRRRAFGDSFTFAAHFFAFSLIWLSALFPTLIMVATLLAAIGVHLPQPHALDLAITGLEAAVLAWYLHVALGTVFGLSSSRRLVTVATLVLALFVILKAYHVIVFAVTLYSS